MKALNTRILKCFVRQKFLRNCFMTSLDIKDAYFSLPVDESFQKYLKFYWKGKLYQFGALLT